ncbi:hypothetical protein PhCBS80983_g04268 [Powellomyces hirtus]|uniref:FHA domain-containing protein n=1 Tax=Powellomyces hirtus TaxID=109895 RepID=A0A507DYH9_9FUNG|nr:hypothetical protein PhCBS80983_g04268 [Powellomyces hirtus]
MASSPGKMGGARKRSPSVNVSLSMFDEDTMNENGSGPSREEPSSPPSIIHILLTPQANSPPSSRPLCITSSSTTEANQRPLSDGVPLKLGRAVRSRDHQSAPTFSPVNHSAGKPTLTAAGVLLPNGAIKKTQDFVFFNSKVVSRCHAEIWTRDGQVYLKDTASSSGTFLNRMRLSPSGKESRPYPLKSGDVVQLGIDYVGDKKKEGEVFETVIKDSYRAPVLTVSILHPLPSAETKKKLSLMNMFRQVLGSLLTLTNPYAGSTATSASPTAQVADCVICLSGIGPYQALFLAPCSHCYHFKCVKSLLSQGHMFLCPLCRQVANLDASVSMDSLCELAGGPEVDDMDTQQEQQQTQIAEPNTARTSDDEGSSYQQPDVALAHFDIPPYSGTTPVMMDETFTTDSHAPGSKPTHFSPVVSLNPGQNLKRPHLSAEWGHSRSHSMG